MLSGTQSNSSVDYKSKQLTLDDVKTLQDTFFDEKVLVNIHSDSLAESALLPFCKFLKSLRCLYITVYFEKMDYETAWKIYLAAKKNPHTLKVKLDLGEAILAYIDASILNNMEAQDIADHFISGIYSKVRCLALHYRSMNYVQVDKIFKGLRSAALKTLIMTFDWLDKETMAHLKSKLQLLPLIKDIDFSINTVERLPNPRNTEIAASSSAPIDDDESNCLQRTLTWMMSRLSCAPPAEVEEPDEPTVAHYKLT